MPTPENSIGFSVAAAYPIIMMLMPVMMSPSLMAMMLMCLDEETLGSWGQSVRGRECRIDAKTKRGEGEKEWGMMIQAWGTRVGGVVLYSDVMYVVLYAMRSAV